MLEDKIPELQVLTIQDCNTTHTHTHTHKIMRDARSTKRKNLSADGIDYLLQETFTVVTYQV
jgi:hypothetical protein